MVDEYSGELAVGYALVKLCQATGARSGWVQNGAELIESNVASSESRVALMTEAVHEMVSSYLGVGRTMEAVVLGFREQYLLLACEKNTRVALLFPKSHGEVGGALLKARRFLREHRNRILGMSQIQVEEIEPELASPDEIEVVDLWPSVRLILESLLGRVIGGSQADALIQRVLAEYQLDGSPPAGQIPEISQKVILKVPHRGKQQALLAELADALDEHGLS